MLKLAEPQEEQIALGRKLSAPPGFPFGRAVSSRLTGAFQPSSSLCFIWFLCIQLCNESVFAIMTVTASHSDLFLLPSLTSSVIFCLCQRRDERAALMALTTDANICLDYIKCRVFSVSSGLPRNGGRGCSCWSCGPRTAGLCMCIAQARGTRRHSCEISPLQGKEEENPTLSVSANCMGWAINRKWW